QFRAGRMVVIVDPEDRENEGDLAIAAEKVTPEAINFMAAEGRGLICLSLTQERCGELALAPMVADNSSRFGTAFTVSVDARGKTTTGISAADRAATILTAVDPASGPEDLVRPGHVFPLAAVHGGVLRRSGQTEASVDLARLAGLRPAGVICEVMNADGTMSRLPDLTEFARRHELPLISIGQLIRYRLRNERLVERVASPRLPTSFGEFRVLAYRSPLSGEEHLALKMGEWEADEPVLVRLHSQCLTGDVFGSSRCDCGEQLERALEAIAAAGRGALVYLLQEGRGIGLLAKLQAYELQDQGHDTVEANELLGFSADQRDYGIGAQILRDLGANRVRLMTNNPEKQTALETYGIEVVERIPVEVPANEETREYLRTKRDKLGHLLKLV
ncbi:MAG TPA: bifunctional 3,4-dihydroxy-2-butanone-4-phosphate synthase/GTP cyclohydrolase II, partial [Thermoanaerobaculia bacterium]|nr:bifunctional 3,4-dihydroxy-2-butanone-4-phosphate synthase/GTP cyclohydrolase II [Thermoanaerobaculia bacterium]